MSLSTHMGSGQHSLFRSFLLSVLPGVATTAAFLVLKPLLEPSGYPPLLAFLLAVLLIDLPIMLGIMLYEGKKLNGRYRLEGIHSGKSFAVVAKIFAPFGPPFVYSRL